MNTPTCPGCTPRLSWWPGGRAWGHAGGCIYDDGRKIDYAERLAPSVTADESIKRRLARSRRHSLESARTGVLAPSKPRSIEVRGLGGERCPAHPSELRWDCRPCTDEGD